MHFATILITAVAIWQMKGGIGDVMSQYPSQIAQCMVVKSREAQDSFSIDCHKKYEVLSCAIRDSDLFIL